MQYKVPQNIDLEDKIVGPLTLMQFIYLIFGGLIDYIAYQIFYDPARFLFFLIAFPTTIVALGLAFVKVYDRPLGTFIKHALSFQATPKERIWKKEESMEGTSVITGPTAKKEVAPPVAKQLPQSELAKLSEVLDTYSKPSTSEQVPSSIQENRPGPS